MTAEGSNELTLGQSLIWVNWMFSMTERITGAIPAELLDWRPESADGEHQFSLAEIVMHITDARRMFASQLTGADYSAEYYAPDYWSGKDVSNEEFYRFKPYSDKDALLANLKQARKLYEPFLSLPLSELGHITEGARKAFEAMLAQLREAGVDTVPHEKHGPGTVTHTLLAVIAHESGHRGALGTLLRLNGVTLPE